jgi:hypothetical protein
VSDDTAIMRTQAADCAGEWLVLIAGEMAGSSTGIAQTIREQLPNCVKAAVHLFAFDSKCDREPASNIIRALPLRISLLVEPPEARHVITFGPDVSFANNSFRELSHPLWDWLIRAAETPNAVMIGESLSFGKKPPATELYRALPELAPERPNGQWNWLRDHIRQLDVDRAIGSKGSRNRSIVVRAGLLQLHDFLEESHELAQTIEGDPNADYWHGIMHRREPDASNAKYWFRHVGRHPVFEPLADAAAQILATSDAPSDSGWSAKIVRDGRWEPFPFIDLCEECRKTNGHPLETIAKQIQLLEMLLLLQWSLK